MKDMGMTGLASAWAIARRRTKYYRRKVTAATHCSCVCPHTRPDQKLLFPNPWFLSKSGVAQGTSYLSQGASYNAHEKKKIRANSVKSIVEGAHP